MYRYKFVTVAAFAVIVLTAPMLHAKNTGLVFVGNEKSNTITILDRDNRIVKTM